MLRSKLLAAAAINIGILGVACDTKSSPTKPASTKPAASAPRVAAEPADHGHHHHAPHGGTLVGIGDHFAHVELVLDADAGKLTAFVLDGEAEKSVRLVQPEIAIRIQLAVAKVDAGASRPFTLRLVAIANALTGEKSGDASEFGVQDDRLKAAALFEGVVERLSIKGRELSDVRFSFPGGNE